MELKSFRELLLKMALGDEGLRDLIFSVDDDYLIGRIEDALEKSNMGHAATGPVVAFSQQATGLTAKMLRDQLAHHVNHYRSALKAHQATQGDISDNYRKVADQHLNKIVPIMHLIDRASRHSDNELALKYPNIRPWEENYTRPDHVNEKGRSIVETDGLNLSHKIKPHHAEMKRNTLHESHPDYETQNAKLGGSAAARRRPDYRFLEMPPHPLTKLKAESKGAYPFELIQVGPKLDIMNNEGYLHLKDVDSDVSKFTPHELDEHPVMPFATYTTRDLNDPAVKNFEENAHKWIGVPDENSHPSYKKWYDRYVDGEMNHPEYDKRGKAPSPSFWEGLKQSPYEHHAQYHHDKKEEARKKAEEDAAALQVAQPEVPQEAQQPAQPEVPQEAEQPKAPKKTPFDILNEPSADYSARRKAAIDPYGALDDDRSLSPAIRRILKDARIKAGINPVKSKK